MGGGGGSGGGGFGISPEELAKLEASAKQSLADAERTERRNVFISFAYEDVAEVNLLRGQAKNENSGIEFNDWSLSEPFDSVNAESIRTGIRERIRQSSVTLVYVSEYTHQSRWVDWEIRESRAQGKGVLAVYKGSTPPQVLPPSLGELGVPLVRWSHSGVAAAIEDAYRNRLGG